MNRENIQRVRDVIAGLPRKRFTMAYFAAELDGDDISPPMLRHSCNTAGCIAGWTVASVAPRVGVGGPFSHAQRLLGLTTPQADDLFTPPGYDKHRYYTQGHAVRVLDHLLATGEVDWKSTRRAKKATA